MNLQIDESFLINTLKDLVRINSINPNLSPEGKGEAEIGAYLGEVLRTLGLSVRTDEVTPGRVNVIGTLKGRGDGPSLLLNAHLDTVGVEGMTIDPFGAEIRDGKLFGRGAQDMKGSLAAMVAAVKALVDAGIELGGDLLVTGVADEEYASIGMEHLVKQVKAEGAIVTEPTDLKIGAAHRGFIWFEVETFGRAAHGSRFKEGIDANMRMGRFLSRLEGLERELRERPPHPLAGPPSLHAAILQGGSEPSIYAAHCLCQIERRTIPGETTKGATAEIQAIIDQLVREDPSFIASVKATFDRDPFETWPNSRIVKTLDSVASTRSGAPAAYCGQTFWTDAALLAAAGMDVVLLGPTGQGLHSQEEWVDLGSVIELAQILAETALAYCSQPR